METVNTPPQIRRVRRVGDQWHVTYTDGRPATAVPCVNPGRYTSRVSFGFATDGALTAEQAGSRP
jgi:hypothetical protein